MSASVNSPRAREPRRSTRGASLPLVLLLFLICAMASSIVLAAASAAAGRAAGLADSEQLYYSATSAARLFRDEIMRNAQSNGNGSQPEKGHEITVFLSQQLAADGSTAVGSPMLTLRDDGKNVDALADCTLLQQATLFALFGERFDKVLNVQQWITSSGEEWDDWAENCGEKFPGSGQRDEAGIAGRTFANLQMKHDGSRFDAEVCKLLDLPIRAEISPEGNLLFCFFDPRSTVNLKADTDVIVTLTCEGNYDVEHLIVRDDSAVAPGEDALYDVQIVTVTWTPSAIEEGVGSHAN